MLVDKYEYRSSVGCNFTSKNQRSFGEGYLSVCQYVYYKSHMVCCYIELPTYR